MARPFKLAIRTPEGEFFAGDVTSIRINTEGGQVKMLAKHATIAATVVFSPVWVEADDSTEEFFVRRGVIFFDNIRNEATLLVNYCTRKAEMSRQTVEEYLKFIEERLTSGEKLSGFEIGFLEGEKLAVKMQLKG